MSSKSIMAIEGADREHPPEHSFTTKEALYRHYKLKSAAIDCANLYYNQLNSYSPEITIDGKKTTIPAAVLATLK